MAAKNDYEAYLNELEDLCKAIKPKKIIEFGSGASTRIFGRYGDVTCVEYNPPGDWLAKERGVEGLERVRFHFVQPESQAFPRNLYEAFHSLIGRELSEDMRRESKMTNGQPPIWDLAYIDGAVHSEGVVINPQFPGWCPGDISYLTRASIAGLCMLVAKHVVVDGLSYMPAMQRLKVDRSGRFFVLKS